MKNTQNEQIRQKIRRIKTQHNDSAKIDHQHLLEQTKILHQNSILYAKYVDKLTDDQFAIKPLQIGFVQSLTLKDDPKFKQIRHLLQKYNQQTLRYDQKSAPGLHLKTIVMDSMLKFLRLMMMAPDALGKKRILDIAYYWFKKNLDSIKKQRKTKQILQKQVRTILLESKLVPKSIIQKQLPSEKLKQQLYNYQIQARTNYKQLNAPSFELENYITHKIGFVNQNQKYLNQQNNNKKSLEELRQEKWRKRVLFKKPFIEEPNYSEIQEEDKYLNQNQKEREREREREINIDNQNIGNNNQVTGDNLNKQGEKLPGQQNDPNNTNLHQQNLPPGMQDIVGDDIEGQEQVQEQEIKRGKLDPLVKIFLKDRQKRIKTQGEVSAQNKIQYVRNKKLEDKRIDEANAKFLTQWAGNRSRFKSELSRKIQSIRAFSSVTKVKQQIQPIQKIRVEDTINRVKLNETLKQYGAYIHKDPIRERLNTETSMSLFDRKRVKTQVSSTMRPFSTVIEDKKRLVQKSEYLDQISMLKEKFAKYKLYTPLDNFKKAIIHPEEKQCDWAQLDKITGDNIQLPRTQMISNPFANFGKKKKKKGKKKK